MSRQRRETSIPAPTPATFAELVFLPQRADKRQPLSVIYLHSSPQGVTDALIEQTHQNQLHKKCFL